MSGLNRVVDAQVRRVEALMNVKLRPMGVRWALPAIVTLHPGEAQAVDGVPIIPIHKLRSFLMEFLGWLDRFRVIRC